MLEGLASYDRFIEVKTRYGPANIFRFNANIRPSPSGGDGR